MTLTTKIKTEQVVFVIEAGFYLPGKEVGNTGASLSLLFYLLITVWHVLAALIRTRLIESIRSGTDGWGGRGSRRGEWVVQSMRGKLTWWENDQKKLTKILNKNDC